MILNFTSLGGDPFVWKVSPDDVHRCIEFPMGDWIGKLQVLITEEQFEALRTSMNQQHEWVESERFKIMCKDGPKEGKEEVF